MKYANTPLEIWVDLRERFGKESAPKAYELKQSLTNTHQEAKENERLYEFLMGLNGEFSTIRTQILSMSPIPTLRTAYHIIAKDEQQRAIFANKRTAIDSAAFQAFPPSRPEDFSTQKWNKSTQKDVKNPNNSELEHCEFCGRDGHNRKVCFK
ncbi:uncharacterized protein LOC111888542 [Lactuca sativa]|uniref:uncharacterized protein LOC111888542 n=1 Tax=Lactuca sativa TaxID=4236 RepID=UPI000CD832FB|nr:uncharacterized protein LOC111888542 [Lactuca sativa]